jgi:hypothetical protein
LNTSGSKYRSHEDFMARAQPAERWLYAVNTERLERVPILEAMATQVITPATKLSWLSHKDISASIWSLEVRLPVDLLRKLPIVGKGGINARVLEALLATYKD